MKKPSRNDSCHCGSGKKYKQCCLQRDAVLASGKRSQVVSQEFFVPQLIQTALEHQRAGQLSQAEECYKKVLLVEPDHPEVLHMLGMLAYRAGNNEIALVHVTHAIAANSSNPVFHNNLGAICRALSRLDEAAACFRKALLLKRDYVDARYNLGIVLKDMGKLDEAIACYRMALELKPDYAEAHNNLGVALKEQGKPDEALACYQKAVVLKPEFAEAHNNLGVLLKDREEPEAAIASYRRALSIRPDFIEAHYNLGCALKDQHKLDEAVASFGKVLASKPDHAEAYNNLGALLKEQGRPDEAIGCYQKALELKPDYAEPHSNMGALLKDQGKFDEAIACYNKALTLKPEYAEVHSNLGLTLASQGKLDEAILSLRKALALKPRLTDTHTNLIFTLDLSPEVDIAVSQQERRNWDAVHAAPLMPQRAHGNAPDPERRLRIGYVSGDLRQHSAAKIFGAMLVRFDPSRFDVYAYSNSSSEDEYTRLFRGHVTCWRRIVGMSDEAVADLIRQNEIDILVDLSGHTAGNRLLVFARKPAPIQVTAWGYATSTGMRAMDVFFADPVVVPPEEKAFFAEEVRYLPSVVGFFCPEIFPPVNALPALNADGVTFGSFNRIQKISEAVFKLWAQVLSATPNSRMVLKTAELDDQSMREHVLQRFMDLGIAHERITLLGKTPWQEQMAAFSQIDIALDPFPHGGGVTTLEGLMMGIPHVTLRWPSIAGRLSASILTTLGFTDWIADTPEQYVQIAVQKAQDLTALAELRGRLRGLFTSSVIGDPNLYVAAVEKEYRQLWREWCERQQNCLS